MSFHTSRPAASPAHPLRRSLIKAQIGNTSLEAKVFALEQRLAERDQQLEASTSQADKLTEERIHLNRAYENAMAAKEKVQAELEAEHSKHSKELERHYKQTRQLEDTTFSLRNELDKLGRTHLQSVNQSRSEKDVLESKMERLQEERDSLVHMREQAHQLGQALEAKERELDQVRILLSHERDKTGSNGSIRNTTDGDDHAALRNELHRQAGLLASMGKTNQTLQAENAELRIRRDNVEVSKAEAKELAKRAKRAEDKLAVTQEALDRARKDVDMLTISIPDHSTSSDEPTLSLAETQSLQQRLSQLSAAHALCGMTISAKQATILDYSNRLEQVARDTSTGLEELKQRAEAAEREARWAVEARERADKRLTLACQELEVLRSQSRKVSTATEPSSNETSDQSNANVLKQQVKDLEEQVHLYRRAIDDFQSDNRENQARAILDLDLVKRTDLTAAHDQSKALTQEIEALKATIDQHEKAYDSLRQEAADMDARLGSGEYNAQVWRAVGLKESPATRDLAVRRTTLDKLRSENEALVDKLVSLQKQSSSDHGQAGTPATTSNDGAIPIETFERYKQESEADKALYEKRLLRLREVGRPYSLIFSLVFLASHQPLTLFKTTFFQLGIRIPLQRVSRIRPVPSRMESPVRRKRF